MILDYSSSLFSNLKLSWQANLLFVLTTVVAFASAFPGVDVPVWVTFLLALGIALAMAGFIHLLMLLSKPFSEFPKPRALTLFVIQILIIGLFRGYAFYLAVELVGLTQPTPLPVRLLTSTINTAIWLTFSCALVEATVHYSKQFNNLFRALSFAIAKKPEFRASENLDSLDNLVSLKSNLSEILAKASDKGITSDVLLAAGVAVREQIENLIKPLSHRLWFNEKRNQPQIRIFGLTKDSFEKFSFKSARFLIVFGALEFAAILGAYSLPRVIFGVALSMVLLLLVIFLFRMWQRSASVSESKQSSLTFILLMGLIPVPLADLMMPLLGLERMLFPLSAATVVGPIAIMVLLVVESCINLVEQDRQMLNQHFARELQNEGDFSPAALASYLHNSLQSELTGIAYRLEAAAVNPNSPESRATLEKLGALINRSISQDFANFEEAPLLRLERMVEAWDGIAEVSYQIDDACKLNPRHLNTLVQIIEEATTNSVRHGKAKNIDVQITRVGSLSRVEITTDATEPKQIATGFGSKWLLDKSAKQNPIEFTGHGTRQVIEV